MQQAAGGRGAMALRARAAKLAAAWSEAATATTTLGRERAILRFLGVGGPSATGRPIVVVAAERYFSANPGRLAHGIALPFAHMLVADGLTPSELAAAVADGSVDLGSATDALDNSGVRDAARRTASRLTAATLERLDANRTARGELQQLLGEPPRPLLGAVVRAGTLGSAARTAAAATDGGADLVVLAADAVEPDHAVVHARSVPGLAGLRSQFDEAGAMRGQYVRLGVEIDALAADQAVAAGLERADLALADPMAAIVSGAATPGHAIADHVFACRVLARAAMDLLVPAGPIVVAPDLQSGIASSPAVRSGRALAIQLLAVALAEGAGIDRHRITVAGLPAWLADEQGAVGHAVAELAARRIVFAGCGLALVEPEGTPDAVASWLALATVLLADGGIDVVTVRHQDGGDRLAVLRGGATVAAGVCAARHPGALAVAAAKYRDAMLDAADRELDALEAGGWAAIIGDPLETAAGEPRSGVARQTDGFNPLG
jgi:hypothetical protein